MKKITTLSFLFLFTCSTCFAQTDSVLVSNVKFKNSKFDNPHAGSGFLLEYSNKVYAVTAKHVLFFAKTDSMKTVSFGDELKSWEFISKLSPTKKILAGKLINENINEPIEMPPKGDWLIFDVSEDIIKDVFIYKLRREPLKEGEKVRFLGYPYNSSEPVNITGSFIGFTEDGNLRLDVPRGNYAGCSGGPVLDKNGKLVGVVSLGYYNEKDKKMIFEPASLDYFKNVISSI